MASAKPGQPPTGADFSALVKKVNALAVKAGEAPLSALITGRIPAWKRWVGGEGPDYDVTGLRDVVKTNADFLDAVKHDVDIHGERLDTQAARIAALEAQPTTSPFPG